MDSSAFEQLRALWLRHKVIFLRQQNIDLDELMQFSQHFGELMQLPYIKSHDDYPYIIRVLKEADEVKMGVFGGDWHSDFSFLEAPPSASILYAEQVPEVGGDTLWIDMGAALAALPAEQKQLLQGKYAIHSGTPYGIAHAPAAPPEAKARP